MKTTKIIVPFAVLAIVLTIASGALARQGGGHGMGQSMNAGMYGGHGGYGQHMGAVNSLTPEKQVQFNKRMREFMDSNQSVRNDLAAAQLELQALSGNPNAKPERITELAKTIANLRAQLDTAHRNHMLSMEKEFGIRMPTSAGYGMGAGRMGRGAGHMNGAMHGGKGVHQKGQRMGPQNGYHNGPRYAPRYDADQSEIAPQNG